jgi:hypothetical protein
MKIASKSIARANSSVVRRGQSLTPSQFPEPVFGVAGLSKNCNKI